MHVHAHLYIMLKHKAFQYATYILGFVQPGKIKEKFKVLRKVKESKGESGNFCFS